MVNTLTRAIEVAVFTPFRAWAAMRAATTYGCDPYDDWFEHDEDH
jgi:hypothetical protein